MVVLNVRVNVIGPQSIITLKFFTESCSNVTLPVSNVC